MKKSILAFGLLLAAPAVYAADKHDHSHGASAAKMETSAAAPAAQTVTVQGELVDMGCFFSHEGHGEQHKQCAEMCIKAGGPMGLYTKDNQVYLLLQDHAAKKSYDGLRAQAGKQVKVTGTQKSQGGVQAVIVASGEAVK